MNRTTLLVLTVSLALAAGCATANAPGDCASVMIGGETLSSDVLIERVGLARAEHENLRDGVPFGERNEEWENLKSAIEPGDNIWFYRDNRTITGAEGYVVVRDCEVVAFFMTTKY